MGGNPRQDFEKERTWPDENLRHLQRKNRGIASANFGQDDTIEFQFGEVFMTVKEKILHTVEQLPADTTIEEAMDRLYLLYKVEKGLQQVAEGKTVSQAEAKERMHHWLK